jgi:ribosomal protein L17
MAKTKKTKKTRRTLTERETLLRDMRALRESIDFDKIEMVSGNWKATERKEILEHMVHCIKKLQKLHNTLKISK